MDTSPPGAREGGLKAPSRHPLLWQDPEFTDPEKLDAELARVFDICHGCRRCVNLCQAFPTLFDLIDESDTMEVDGVDAKDFEKVVDHCYLCDLCFMTKCPYVPPHEWNVDFPHLMLRAKHARFRRQSAPLRDRALSSPEKIGKFLGIPILAQTVNAFNRNPTARKLLHRAAGIHQDAVLPKIYVRTARARLKDRDFARRESAAEANAARKVLLFATCYGNHNHPALVESTVRVLEHNGVEVRLHKSEQCCGMPKMELGDLESVRRLMAANLPLLHDAVEAGYAITAPVPSCVLMFKKELPLLFPEEAQVQEVAQHFYDPFEYLAMLHKQGRLNTQFSRPLGRVTIHSACHQRVQNIGNKTRDILSLIPGTTLTTVERCSGHDGTYAVKRETHAAARKICRPITRQLNELQPDHYGSDCPLAESHIAHCAEREQGAQHPIELLRHAYGI